MRRNLRLIKLEAIVTFFALGAVEAIYLLSRGFSLGEIGVIHTAMTATLILVNIPTGYLADITSRRTCNFIGDALAGTGLIGLAMADSFVFAIALNVVIATGLSLSLGADTALLKAACEHLDEEYLKHQTFIYRAQSPLRVGWAALAGIVATQQPSAGVLLVALPYIIGTLVSLFIKETRAPAEPVAKGIKKALRFSCANKKVRWAMITGSISMAIAGTIQRLAAPIMEEGGMPPLLVGSAWALYFLAFGIGTWCCEKLGEKYKLPFPSAILLAVLALFATDVNRWTIFAFPLFGLAQGMLGPLFVDIILDAALPEFRATIISVYATVIQIFFMGCTLAVSVIASNEVDNVMKACFLLLTLPFVGAISKVIRYCK